MKVLNTNTLRALENAAIENYPINLECLKAKRQEDYIKLLKERNKYSTLTYTFWLLITITICVTLVIFCIFFAYFPIGHESLSSTTPFVAPFLLTLCLSLMVAIFVWIMTRRFLVL